jgi:hypothetical protein
VAPCGTETSAMALVNGAIEEALQTGSFAGARAPKPSTK